MKTNCILSLAVCFGVAYAVQAQDTLTNGLVAYYPFNGNANDASGNGNDGTVTGATLTTDRFGNINSAFHFTGNGSTYISVPDSPSIELTNSLTVTAWIKTAGGGYAQPRIVSKGSYQLLLSDTGQTPQAVFTIEGVSVPDSALSPPLSLNGANWIFLAGTYNGSAVRVYTNGILAGQTDVTGNVNVYHRPVGIGENLDDFSDYVLGDIDDVRIYSRALSDSEVATLYAMESPPILNLRKAVYLDSTNLRVGTNYQVQVSTDLNTWTNYGAAFTATNSTWRSTNYWDVDNWDQLFFRLEVAP